MLRSFEALLARPRARNRRTAVSLNLGGYPYCGHLDVTYQGGLLDHTAATEVALRRIRVERFSSTVESTVSTRVFATYGRRALSCETTAGRPAAACEGTRELPSSLAGRKPTSPGLIAPTAQALE